MNETVSHETNRNFSPIPIDLLVVLALAVGTALLVYWQAQQIGPDIFKLEPYGDTWFDSDVAAYYITLDNPEIRILYDRAYKHPLLPMIFCLPTFALKAFHISTINAVHILVSAVASVWMISLFGFLRLLGCQIVDATLLSLLGLVSAAGLFWLPILESYPLGSLGYIWALGLVAFASKKQPPFWSGALISAVNLSVTTTNWLIGWLSTSMAFQWRKVLRINGIAFAIVLFLIAIQKVIFDASLPFEIPGKEFRYIHSSESGSAMNIIQSAFFHTIVMPDIQMIDNPGSADRLSVMTTQFSAPGSGGIFGMIAIGLWSALLALGLWQLFTARTQFKLRTMLGLSLLSQLVLHLIYTGRETFLYSLHFLPFLIGIVALGRFAKQKGLFLILLILTLACVGINNFSQFQQASAFYEMN